MKLYEYLILREERRRFIRSATRDFQKAGVGLFRGLVHRVPWDTVQFLSSSFNTSIRYLDAGVECIISTFTDDTQLGGAVNSPGTREALQRDLGRLETGKWSTG